MMGMHVRNKVGAMLCTVCGFALAGTAGAGWELDQLGQPVLGRRSGARDGICGSGASEHLRSVTASGRMETGDAQARGDDGWRCF